MVPDDFMLNTTGAIANTSQAETDWNNIVNRLLSQNGEVRLVFDRDAQSAYNEYLKDHIQSKNAKSLYGYEAAVCGKLEIYAIIWAMTTAILRYAELGDTEEVLCITEGEMSYTLRCMEYFRGTAMRVYERITLGSNSNISKKDWIRVGYQNGYYSNQTKMADTIGVSQEYVNQILRGKK